MVSAFRRARGASCKSPAFDAWACTLSICLGVHSQHPLQHDLKLHSRHGCPNSYPPRSARRTFVADCALFLCTMKPMKPLPSCCYPWLRFLCLSVTCGRVLAIFFFWYLSSVAGQGFQSQRVHRPSTWSNLIFLTEPVAPLDAASRRLVPVSGS